MTALIGLAGYAGSGKSTVVDYIQTKGWQRMKFAAPLKDQTRSLLRSLGVSEFDLDRYIEGDLKEVPTDLLFGKSPREYMQWIGHSTREFLGADYWVWAAFGKVRPHGLYIFDDLRYYNEAMTIRQRGGLTVQVRRPGVEALNEHISENDLEGHCFNYVIWNDGSMGTLYERVDEFFGWVKEWSK
jgi:hypothetical protein